MEVYGYKPKIYFSQKQEKNEKINPSIDEIESCSQILEIDIPKIRNSDPLELDYLFKDNRFSEFKNQNNSQQLQHILSDKLKLNFDDMPKEEQHASLRDFGFILGYILQKDPNFMLSSRQEMNLEKISNNLNINYPYHTVLEYTILNPIGNRRRTFTNTDQERVFIDQVEKSYINMVTINKLVMNTNLSDEDIINKLQIVEHKLQSLVLAIPEVMKKVGPEFFASNLRPYFNSLNFKGIKYDGPGGSQLPIAILDRVIWADSKNINSNYEEFINKNVKYFNKNYIEFMKYYSKDSFVTQISRNEFNPEISKAVNNIIIKLISFRKPHEKLAIDSFKSRSEGSLGSGGYTPELLTEIIDLINVRRND